MNYGLPDITSMIADLEDEYELIEATLAEAVETELATTLADMIIKNAQLKDLTKISIRSATSSVSGAGDSIHQARSVSGDITGTGVELTANVDTGYIISISFLGDANTVLSVGGTVLATGSDLDATVIVHNNGVPVMVQKTMEFGVAFPGIKTFALNSTSGTAVGSLQLVVMKPRLQEAEAIL